MPESPNPAHRDRRRRPTATTSLALLVVDPDPEGLVELVERATRVVSAAGRLEVLVLDDHASHQRRELLEAVDCLRVRTRLVPATGEGRTHDLDALSTGVGSEFVVVASPGRPPLDAVDGALERMWTAGADAAVIGLRATPGGSGEGSGEAVPGARVAAALGVGSRPVADVVVVLRRWVARWLLDDVASSLDAAAELADRARLLGMGLVEVPLPHPRHPSVSDPSLGDTS